MKTVAAAFAALVASTVAQDSYNYTASYDNSSVDQDYFTVTSSRSGSLIHLLPLNANGGKFFLGGSPSSFCPPQFGNDCKKYPGKYTVFVGGEGTLGLGVGALGGQQGMSYGRDGH